jgi:copper chaperone CopZ
VITLSNNSIYFAIGNVNGKHGLKKIKKEINTLPGIESVSVNLKNNRVSVDYNTEDIDPTTIEHKLNDIGCTIIDASFNLNS